MKIKRYLAHSKSGRKKVVKATSLKAARKMASDHFSADEKFVCSLMYNKK